MHSCHNRVTTVGRCRRNSRLARATSLTTSTVLQSAISPVAGSVVECDCGKGFRKLGHTS